MNPIQQAIEAFEAIANSAMDISVGRPALRDAARREAIALKAHQQAAQGVELLPWHGGAGQAEWRATMRDLLNHIEQHTCMHEDTYRGGAIWEICRECGAKWADDQGGRPEFTEPAYVERARDLLADPAPEATQPTQADAPSEREAFEDSRVQAVYDLLCDETPPPKGEHWEGFAARRIVAALATQPTQAEAPSEREIPDCSCGNSYLAIRTDVYKDGREFVYCDCCGAMATRDLWRAALATQQPEALAQQERDREDAELFRWLSNTNWYVGPEPDSDVGYCNANIGDLRGELRAARSSEGGEA